MNGSVSVFLNWLLLVLGMILLVKGADLFVGGARKIARALKIPSLIIGLTLVSMGTSAPEAAVSVTAAVNNMNEMSISNVVGSNLVNTLVILGFSAVVIPLVIDKDMKKYDIPIMVGIYFMLMLFGFVITPCKLDLIESISLLVIFVGYILFLIIRAMKKGHGIDDNNDKKETKWGVLKSIIFVGLG